MFLWALFSCGLLFEPVCSLPVIKTGGEALEDLYGHSYEPVEQKWEEYHHHQRISSLGRWRLEQKSAALKHSKATASFQFGLGNYSSAAVAVDGEGCTTIGIDVLKEGGSAADAAIAALVCNGVYNSQSMGIGGGFFMTIYDAQSKKAFTLNAREAAPAAATENMFDGDSELSQNSPLSVAVPGEIAGYWEAKTRFGNPSVSWARLFAPTIDICRNGIKVSSFHANALAAHELKDPAMRKIFIDPSTGEVWREGDVYLREDFANLLEKLAIAGDAGVDRLGFYTGEVAEALVDELWLSGGILSYKDFENYRAQWTEPIKIELTNGEVDVYSVPPPGSGAILGYILNILDLYNIQPQDENPLMYHRIIEAMKWAYAQRTKLGDPSDPEITDIVNQLVANLTSEAWAVDTFENIDDDRTFNNASHYGAEFYSPDDHGTAQVSILAENGDAVSATSTVNLFFGSKIMSPSTGVIFNNEMDDFSTPNLTSYYGVPPSPNNFIKGGKRPLSSMCPSIVVNKDGEVRMVVGAAGGTKITTTSAQVMVDHLWLGKDIKTSIDTRRFHHQLAPMYLQYEKDFPQDVLLGLEERGHEVVLGFSDESVVNAVTSEADGRIYANSDGRKGGGVDGY